MKAATRDASWYGHPSVSGFVAVHIDNGDMFALCNSHVLLSPSMVWQEASSVPEDVRCRRPACANAYRSEDS